LETNYKLNFKQFYTKKETLTLLLNRNHTIVCTSSKRHVYWPPYQKAGGNH